MEIPLQVPLGLTFETDVSPTEWVDERLLPPRASGEGVRVGEIVPTGFEAYARILHPAGRRAGDRYEPVTWGELARERGKRIHPEVQLKALLGDEFRDSPSWGDLPEEDSIPEPLRIPLVDILRRSTSTAGRCWFCIWAGFGSWGGGVAYLAADRSPLAEWSRRRRERRETRSVQKALDRIPTAPIMHGTRDCLVFTGPIDAVPSMSIGGRHPQSPNWWWPDDRAWVVVSELDAPSTYIGGSAELARAILDEPRLEAVPSGPEHRFDSDGDRINAPGGS